MLDVVAAAAVEHFATLAARPVGASESVAKLRSQLDTAPPAGPEPAAAVVAALAELGRVGTVATAGPRYFGFVNGGSAPAALGAELLATCWDQNAAMAVMSPLASVLEEVAARWLLDLLGLPASASVGFVTGGQAATTTCLAAARHHVLAAAGWDVRSDGLFGAPPVTTVVGAERHATVDAALVHLGLGAPTVVVDADDQGRMRPDALRDALAGITGPLVVVAQAGNVCSGATDPLGAVAHATHTASGWLHVDGAFGLWLAAAPDRAALVAGAELADSWGTDGHKWLNVPYDCGYAICAHPGSHRAATASAASYYVLGGDDDPRDGMDWTLDASRRARGIATYAAIRSLGRSGVAELVERCCALAARAAATFGAEPGVEVLNEVVANQVVVRFGDDDHTRAVVAGLQDDGTCWAGGALWRGRAVMRWSVSNWSTTTDDIDRSVAAVIAVHRRLCG